MKKKNSRIIIIVISFIQNLIRLSIRSITLNYIPYIHCMVCINMYKLGGITFLIFFSL